LVAIAVSAGLIVLAFASGTLSGLGGSFAGIASGEGNAVAQNFAVEQGAFTYPGGVSLYVRNVGTVPVTLVSVFIVDQSTNTFVVQVAISQTLSVGALVDIPYTTLAFNPSHGSAYSFKVTSSLGSSVTFIEEAN
jgi:hypothetical protein